jgi:hypothetical protein
MHQEPEKTKPPKHQAADFPETSLRNIFIPRIGDCSPRHRGVSCPVAGPDRYQVAPDADTHYISNPMREPRPAGATPRGASARGKQNLLAPFRKALRGSRKINCQRTIINNPGKLRRTADYNEFKLLRT